ncbi:MAG: transcriptional repressor [Firmicutes bacterium]|nr:transcriptional repressor [Bacillota bacterium]
MKLIRESGLHPSAESLCVLARKRYPSLSLNTVYRTLDLFEKKGLVRRFDVGENVYRYDGNTTPHAHFFCIECNRLDDMDGEHMNLICRVGEECSLKFGVKVVEIELLIRGVCLECMKRGGDS